MSYFSGASWVWAFCFGFRKKKYREHWYICWQLLIPRGKTSIQKYIFKSFLRILECLKLLICIFHDKLENLHLLIYLRLSNSLSLSPSSCMSMTVSQQIISTNLTFLYQMLNINDSNQNFNFHIRPCPHYHPLQWSIILEK